MTKKKVYLILILAVILAIGLILILWSCSAGKSKDIASDNTPEIEEYDRELLVVENNGLLNEKKEFDTAIIKDGLREMGFLITEEYWFTEVASYSSVQSFLGYDLLFTESSYLVSYDGHVSAGIDFRNINVYCDEDAKTIRVTLPSAKIKDVVIDTDSFTLYSEKNGFGNHISVSDYNKSLSELKENAREKAKEKDLLKRAGENAESIVKNFIESLPECKEYTVKIVY